MSASQASAPQKTKTSPQASKLSEFRREEHEIIQLHRPKQTKFTKFAPILKKMGALRGKRMKPVALFSFPDLRGKRMKPFALALR
jgi:hypothetical protein